MAIAFRASASLVATAGTTSFNVVLPATIQAGDLILVAMTTGDLVTYTFPGTWIKLDTQTETTHSKHEVWRKIAAAGDAGATLNITTSASCKPCISVVAYSGVDQTTPVEASAGNIQTTAGTAHPTASITTLTAQAWLVTFINDRTSTSTKKTTLWTPAIGVTERLDINNSAAASSPWVSTEAGDSNAGVAVGTYSRTATANQSNTGTAWIGALRPAVAGPATTTVGVQVGALWNTRATAAVARQALWNVRRLGVVSNTFGFDADAEGWVATAGSKSTLTYNATTGNPPGSLSSRVTGRNISNVNYWEYVGTWESLGVPAGTKVTDITLDRADYSCTEYVTGAASTAGPWELYDSSGGLIGTLAAGVGFSGTTGWLSTSGTSLAIPADQQASNTTIRLRASNTLATGGSSTAAVTLSLDNVAVSLSYVTPVGVEVTALWNTLENVEAGIQVVGVTTAEVHGTSWTGTVPAGVQAGDLLLYFVNSDNSGSVPNVNASFVSVTGTGFDASGVITNVDGGMGLQYRIVQAGDPASYTFAANNYIDGTQAFIAFRGVDTAKPLNVAAAASTAAGTTHATPALTPTAAGCKALSIFHVNSAGATNAWTPTATADKKRWDITDPSFGASGCGLTRHLDTAAAFSTSCGERDAVVGLTALLLINPPAVPTTPVGTEVAAVWTTRAVASAQSQARWNTRAPVGQVRQAVWRVRVPAAVQRQLLWNVRTRAGTQKQALWSLRAPASISRQGLWKVRALTGVNRQAVWRTRVPVYTTRQVLWKVRSTAGQTRQALWSTRAPAGVQRQALWHTRAPTATARSAVWRVRTISGTQASALWNDLAIVRVAVGAAYAALWNVRANVGAQRQAFWNTRSTVNALRQAIWRVRQTAVLQRQALWNDRVPAAVTRQGLWLVRTRVGSSRQAVWSVRTRVGSSRQALWNARITAAVLRQARWNARALASISRQAPWNVRVTTGSARQALWRVRVPVATVRTSLWNARMTQGVSTRALWNVRGLAFTARQALWASRTLVAAARSAIWRARANAGVSRTAVWRTLANLVTYVVGTQAAALWNVRTIAGAQAAARWNARVLTYRMTSARWNTRTIAGRSVTALWHDRVIAAAQRQASWYTRKTTGLSASALWRVHLVAGVARTAAWHTRAVVPCSVTALWHNLAVTSAQRQALWRVYNVVGAAADAAWQVRELVGLSGTARWRVYGLGGFADSLFPPPVYVEIIEGPF